MPPINETKAGRPDMGPIGLGDETAIINNVEDRVRESRDQSNEWNQKADRNKRMYYAGKDPAPAEDELCFNRIRSDIKTAVNQQTRQPASIKLKPVETNDPGEWYDPSGQIPGPIDPMMAEQLQMPVPTGEVQTDPQTGQQVPVAMPGMQLFNMDDKAVADFWQRQFDARFRPNIKKNYRGMWPAFRQVALDAAICGFKFPVFEWNLATQYPKLWTSISVWDTHTDAIGCDNFEESQFFGVDWLLDEGQAKQMFPDHAEIIAEWARSGQPKKGKNVVLGGGKDRQYERDMILLRHMWIRNQPILMTQDEVIASGALPVEDVMLTPGGIDEMGQEIPPETQTVLAADPLTGLPPQPIVEEGDDENVRTVPNPDWPTRLAIRHIVTIPELNILVADEECQYADVPAAWVPGDPIPGQLFGTGYPDSFNAAQNAKNRIINAIVEYIETFPVPGASLPEDVAECIQKGLKGHMLKPSDLLHIPTTYWEKYKGDVIRWNVPAPLPESVAQVLNILTENTQETSVNADVSRGRLPGSGGGKGMSGYALQLLMEQNATQFDFPAQWFNELIHRVSSLLLHAMVRWLSTEDLIAVCSEYPPHIVEAFRQRAQSVEWDLDVQLANAVGMQRAKERQEALEGASVISPKTGRPMLSDRTIAERFGEDYDDEQRRHDEEQMAPAAMAAAAAQQATEGEGTPGEGGEKPGGNGQHAGSKGNGRF